MATAVMFHEAMLNIGGLRRGAGSIEMSRLWSWSNPLLRRQVSVGTIAKETERQIAIVAEDAKPIGKVVLFKPFVKLGTLTSNFSTMDVPATANVINSKKFQTTLTTARAFSSIACNDSFPTRSPRFPVCLKITLWILGIPAPVGGLFLLPNVWKFLIFARLIANAALAPMCLSVRSVFVIPKFINRQSLLASGAIFHADSPGSD